MCQSDSRKLLLWRLSIWVRWRNHILNQAKSMCQLEQERLYIANITAGLLVLMDNGRMYRSHEAGSRCFGFLFRFELSCVPECGENWLQMERHSLCRRCVGHTWMRYCSSDLFLRSMCYGESSLHRQSGQHGMWRFGRNRPGMRRLWAE